MEARRSSYSSMASAFGQLCPHDQRSDKTDRERTKQRSYLGSAKQCSSRTQRHDGAETACVAVEAALGQHRVATNTHEHQNKSHNSIQLAHCTLRNVFLFRAKLPSRIWHVCHILANVPSFNRPADPGQDGLTRFGTVGLLEFVLRSVYKFHSTVDCHDDRLDYD